MIPGADAKLKEEEIAFSCHLITSGRGRMTMPAGARRFWKWLSTLQKLIGEGKLVARRARTIRFIFPPEIEGTMALLTGKARVAEQTVQIDDATEHATI